MKQESKKQALTSGALLAQHSSDSPLADIDDTPHAGTVGSGQLFDKSLMLLNCAKMWGLLGTIATLAAECDKYN